MEDIRTANTNIRVHLKPIKGNGTLFIQYLIENSPLRGENQYFSRLKGLLNPLTILGHHRDLLRPQPNLEYP